jgi:DNA-binding winged helix-turn-helix (wHTH) protein
MKICFGPFALDRDTRLLTRGTTALHLSPKAFDLLSTLVDERPNVIGKETLQQRLWPDTFVAEANLANLIAEIRDALDDSPRSPRYVRTAHRIGYAFCGEIAADPGDWRHATCWVEWGVQRFPLVSGEHVIGRDHDVSVRLDASTVSRRHARIVVDAAGAMLEDFGSKNGTFRGDARVTQPVRLADGDAIRIGSQLVTFRVSRFESTETQVGPL